MKIRFALIALLSLLAVAHPALADNDPATPIRLLCERLIETMKLGTQAGFKARESKLRPVIEAVYDMEAVTRSTLGLAAKKLSPEEVTQLAEAYARFSTATYADQFTHWNGEHFDIDPPRPSANGMMEVPSWIVGKDGQRTEISYLMQPSTTGWRIVDVLFEGAVSQVAVRRSEFVPIFRQNGLPALIALLDGKVAAMEAK